MTGKILDTNTTEFYPSRVSKETEAAFLPSEAGTALPGSRLSAKRIEVNVGSRRPVMLPIHWFVLGVQMSRPAPVRYC